MQTSKRELIDMVRDAYLEGFSDGDTEGYVHLQQKLSEFKQSEIYWALRERLGLDRD